MLRNRLRTGRVNTGSDEKIKDRYIGEIHLGGQTVETLMSMLRYTSEVPRGIAIRNEYMMEVLGVVDCSDKVREVL